MPTTPQTRGRQPGFQGSETSSAELTLYPNGKDPIITRPQTPLEFQGRYITDQKPSVVSVSTRKRLNGGGSWSVVVKDGTPYARDTDLRDQIVDDDWADIVFRRHNRPYHVMRGLLENIQRTSSVGGTGATMVTYILSGRDFGWIWEKTPLWFNKFITPDDPVENVVGATAMSVFNSINISGTVEATVRAFLFGFLEELGSVGRANWRMPGGMPGVGAATAFIKNVIYEAIAFTNNPPRLATNPNFMDPNGANAWAMAQEWSDPAFCELWYDLATVDPAFSGSPGVITAQTPEAQLPVSESKMVLFLRDRPFPTLELGYSSPWFSLPTIELQREDLVSDEITRGGTERFNAFFLSPQITQELTGSSAIDITAPLWDKDDMLLHGFRRFDIMSRYHADLSKVAASDTSLLTLTRSQRTNIRDWYVMNPYLYSGTLSLGHGRPDARVGMRARIAAPSQDRTETYYVEEVAHDWSLGPGMRTSLGVTRGWRGTDAAYMDTLFRLSGRYFSRLSGEIAVPAPAPAGQGFA